MVIYKNEYYRLINILAYIAVLFYVLTMGSNHSTQLEILAYIYILLNIFCSFMPKQMFFAWPCLIIRSTGFIRYILMLCVSNSSDTNNVSKLAIVLMLIEMIAQYVMMFVYPLTKPGGRYLNGLNHHNRTSIYNNKLCREPSLKLGVVVILLLCVGGGIVFTQRDILLQYFSLSANASNVTYQSGALALLVSVFFVITYIIAIQFVEEKNMPEWCKIILIIFFSVFFVNGTSVTSDNVSRWSLLITMFIAYNYLIIFHPRQKKKLMVVLIISAIVAILYGTMQKFSGGNSGYDTIKNTIDSSFTYNNLNAYFSGPKNVEISLKMNENLAYKGLSYKIQMIIADVFNNFPLLNKFFGPKDSTSVYWFNLTYYNSTIAKDQIIPLVGQFYNYVRYLFFIPEMLILYFALNVNFKLKQEEDLVKVYCLIYLCFTFSLCNCINFIIMLQNLWIQILPVYLIYFVNEKVIIRRRNYEKNN